jgi:hypothetical protein
MEQEAEALREPGVTLEALQVEAQVSSLPGLLDDVRVARVRIIGFPTEGIDLSEVPVPDCG